MVKEVHVLLEAITLHSRAMTLEVIILVFGFVWIIGWYLERNLASQLIDSSVCTYLDLCGFVVDTFSELLSLLPECECDSTVCDFRASTLSRTLDPWLVY